MAVPYPGTATRAYSQNVDHAVGVACPAASGYRTMLGVDAQEIQAAFDDAFDQAIVLYATADPRTGITPEHLRYRLIHCVRAVATSALTPEIWKRSLEERLLDYRQGSELDGYVWGVKWQAWQALYPV